MDDLLAELERLEEEAAALAVELEIECSRAESDEREAPSDDGASGFSLRLFRSRN